MSWDVSSEVGWSCTGPNLHWVTGSHIRRDWFVSRRLPHLPTADIPSFTNGSFLRLGWGRVYGRGCPMISRLFCPSFFQSVRGAGRRHVTLQTRKSSLAWGWWWSVSSDEGPGKKLPWPGGFGPFCHRAPPPRTDQPPEEKAPATLDSFPLDKISGEKAMRRNQKYSVGGGGRVEQSLGPGRHHHGPAGPGQDQEGLGGENGRRKRLWPSRWGGGGCHWGKRRGPFLDGAHLPELSVSRC